MPGERHVVEILLLDDFLLHEVTSEGVQPLAFLLDRIFVLHPHTEHPFDPASRREELAFTGGVFDKIDDVGHFLPIGLL